MTGQLLARAVVEGRVSLEDEATQYLPSPYPNLANSGENIRLVHLANMTSQLLDNIPDFTQVRTIPGEPLAATRMRVVEQLHAGGIPAPAASRGAAARARHGARAVQRFEHAARRSCCRRSMASRSNPSSRARSKSPCAWAAARSRWRSYWRGDTPRATRNCRPSRRRWRIRGDRCATAPTTCCAMPRGSWSSGTLRSSSRTSRPG